MRMKTLSVFLLIAAATACFAQGGRGMHGNTPFTYASELAPWTGVNNQQILMKLVGTTPDGKAVFQKEDGKVVVTPLANLQEESQERVHECERKMKDAGYTYRDGYWYSAGDLAEVERIAAERKPAETVAPTVKAAARTKMDCRITMKKEDVNPGDFGPAGKRWNFMRGNRPFSVEATSRVIEVDVQSFSASEETYDVHWYIVGRPYSFQDGRGKSEAPQVVESNTETVVCKPQGFSHLQWTSKSYPDTKAIKAMTADLLKSQRMLKNLPDSFGNVEGMAEFHAVIVQLVQDGKLVGSYASSPNYTVTAEKYPLEVVKKP